MTDAQALALVLILAPFPLLALAIVAKGYHVLMWRGHGLPWHRDTPTHRADDDTEGDEG